MRSSEANIQVLCLPNFTQNSYQSLLAGELERLGFSWTLADFGKGNGRILNPLRRFWPKCRIVHLHWLHPALQRGTWLDGWRLTIEIALLRAFRIPVFFTAHNLHHHEAVNPSAEMALMRRVIRLSCRTFVHSPRAAQRVQDALALGKGESEKLTVIEHGNYLSSYPPAPVRAEGRHRFALPDDARVFLLFGYLRRYKSSAGLLDAFMAWSEPSARLLVVGSGQDPDLVADLKQRASRDPRLVVVDRYVEGEELSAAFAAADIAILPYRWQLTSGAAILAMGYGKPLLLPEIAEGELPHLGGNLVARGDWGRALVKALELTPAQLAVIGSENKIRASQLSWARTAHTVGLQYREAMGKRS
jgi:beta-1,4-mannosyltransferase